MEPGTVVSFKNQFSPDGYGIVLRPLNPLFLKPGVVFILELAGLTTMYVAVKNLTVEDRPIFLQDGKFYFGERGEKLV